MINWVPNKVINHERVNELLNKSIEQNQFTNGGPNVRLLEQVIREKLEVDDTKSVIAVTNGSIALHAVNAGIELFHKRKMNWATQSFTFPPSAQGTLSDAKILDIDHECGLNLEEVTDDIGGIIVTNIFGNIVDIDKYVNWSKKHGKYLIFDNAATAYTFYKGKNCVNYGHASTISFHHTKPIGFGEGGAIIIDKIYEESIRSLMNFGINSVDSTEDCINSLIIDGVNSTKQYWLREGSNYKISDISAAYILQYLDHFENIKQKHMQLYDYFKKNIHKLKNIKLFPNFGDKTMLSCFCLLFDKYDDQVRLKLLENNIFCRKYYVPLKPTENAVDIFNKILCVPCTVDMSEKDVDQIIHLIRLAGVPT